MDSILIKPHHFIDIIKLYGSGNYIRSSFLFFTTIENTFMTGVK